MKNEKLESFKKELAQLINKYSYENNSNTPDYILAEFLCNCFENYNKAIQNRKNFYSIDESKF